jgi:hypothetical protein
MMAMMSRPDQRGYTGVGFVAMLASTVLGLFFARRCEADDWNGGVCKCGKRWKHFDNDSHGNRGYVCDSGHYFWASSSVDRKVKNV